MSTTNEIFLAGEKLDTDLDTEILPTFQANDRTKPDTLQSVFTAEFSAPGTVRNHRLLRQLLYKQTNCVLTSGGVETLPLGRLYVKGFKENRYQLQVFGGNLNFVQALGDKTLADLNFKRFDHDWLPAEVAQRLPYAYWAANGWGYEVYERGKPVDFQALNPYDLYPSVSGQLVLDQILADAGFTANSLLDEPLFKALNVPAANPYQFPQAFRDARQLTAGFLYVNDPQGVLGGGRQVGIEHTDEFAERLSLAYTGLAPYHAPTAGAAYVGGRYRADTRGYYDLAASVLVYCGAGQVGTVGCRVGLRVNGADVPDPARPGQPLGVDEQETGPRAYLTLAPKLSRYLLQPGDTVELYWTGVFHKGLGGTVNPTDPYWLLGFAGTQIVLPGGEHVANEVRFTATLLPEFPQGGRVQLAQWLPEMKQLDFVKTYMLLGGLTVQADAYAPRLALATGAQLLANVPRARDWTSKRDAYAAPGQVPERDVLFRFGEYGQQNALKWAEDEHVTPGYGDGTIAVADATLEASYELATLPFAATEQSPVNARLLRILNFEANDLTATPLTYNAVTAKPRLTLRAPGPVLPGRLITVPATTKAAAVSVDVATTASYFAGADVSLVLGSTVLTTYWADLRAMLDESRYLSEYYRLTPRDVAELDFSVPVWDGLLGDYFAVSLVSEYDARRPTEVHLCRLNAAHLGAPVLPGEGDGVEFYGEEFETVLPEFY